MALSSICPRASDGDPAPPAPPPGAGALVGGVGAAGMLVVAQNIILHCGSSNKNGMIRESSRTQFSTGEPKVGEGLGEGREGAVLMQMHR